MTFVGKIFIVLILIMSTLFMGLSIMVYATHRNWKDEVTNPTTGLRTRLQQARDENQKLVTQIDEQRNRLAIERAARRQALAVAETRAQQLDQQLRSREAQYQELLTQQRTAIAAVENSQRQLDELSSQVQSLQTQLVDAQRDRDEQFAKVRDLTERWNQAQGVLSRLEQRNQDLTEQLAKASDVLSAYELTADTPVTNIPPPLDGEVLSVGKELVTVSLGQDDGLRRGHTLEVSRQDKYLGRVVVTEVNPDQAVGRILPGYQRGPIREGDRVQTKVR